MLDLVDGEAIASKYEQNDVIDLNGNISIDSIYNNGKVKIPYLIITGKSETEGIT
jgi:hypothetical protein